MTKRILFWHDCGIRMRARHHKLIEIRAHTTKSNMNISPRESHMLCFARVIIIVGDCVCDAMWCGATAKWETVRVSETEAQRRCLALVNRTVHILAFRLSFFFFSFCFVVLAVCWIGVRTHLQAAKWRRKCVERKGESERKTSQLTFALSNAGCRKRARKQCFESQTNISHIDAQLCSELVSQALSFAVSIIYLSFDGVELVFSAID